jgi:hypothetical protein
MELSYTILVIFFVTHDYLDLIIKKSEQSLYDLEEFLIDFHHGECIQFTIT